MPDVDQEEDDDFLDELPDLGDLSDDEETLGADELGLERIIGDGDEKVGLDDSVGLEDEAPLFALELPPEDAGAETEPSDLDAIPVEGLGGDDEYGWTEDSASAADEPWDPGELDMPSLTPLGHEDGGEEGVDDDFELGGEDGDSVPHLPPLAADLDDDDEPIDDPAFVALAPREMKPMLPAAYDADVCEVARLTPAIPVRSVLVTARTTWAVGDAIFALDGDAVERVRASGLEERRALSLAVGDDGHRLVVGTDRGIARSVDRGDSFQITAAMASDPFRVARERDTDRIWAFTTSAGSNGGRLHRSDDLGGVWSGPLLLSPVAALVTPSDGGVVALCAPKDAAPQLARSVDGGQRWAAVGVPRLAVVDDEERPARLSLAADGDLVALASDADPQGPHLSTDGGRSWLRIPALPPAHALAVAKERGGVSVYAAHRTEEGRALVVRHRPDGADGGAVLELPEPDARVEAIVPGAPSEGRALIFIATTIGLFRAQLTLGAS